MRTGRGDVESIAKMRNCLKGRGAGSILTFLFSFDCQCLVPEFFTEWRKAQGTQGAWFLPGVAEEANARAL